MGVQTCALTIYYNGGEKYKYVRHIIFGKAGEGKNLNPYADMVKGYRDYSRSMMLAQLELRQDLSFLTEGLTFRVMTNTTRNAYFDVARQYKPFYYEMLGIDCFGDYLLNILNEETGEEYLDKSEERRVRKEWG